MSTLSLIKRSARSLRFEVCGIPTSQTLARGLFMVKLDAADDDSLALISKDTSDSAQGAVTDPGTDAGDGTKTGSFEIYIDETDADAMSTTVAYVSAAKAQLDGGKFYTLPDSVRPTVATDAVIQAIT